MSKQVSVKKIKSACVQISKILKALSHPQRLLLLNHLLSGEKSVNQLVELCEMGQSQVSQFLIRMKMEGLIEGRREGRFQYYSVTDKRLHHLMQTIQKQYCH
jgi:DNA-binding transcriptional ArsR family regulator